MRYRVVITGTLVPTSVSDVCEVHDDSGRIHLVRLGAGVEVERLEDPPKPGDLWLDDDGDTVFVLDEETGVVADGTRYPLRVLVLVRRLFPEEEC